MPPSERFRFRRTTLLLTLYLSVLAGVAFAYFSVSAPAIAAWLTIPLLIVFSYKRSFMAILVIALAGVLIGCARGSIYYQHLGTYKSYYGQKIAVEVTAQDDAIYGKSSQLSFVGGGVRLDGHSLPGKIQISGFGMPAVYQGDRILVTGKFFETRGALQGRMSFAKLELIKKQPSLIGSVRRKFASGLTTALPEPLASFSLGLLIGKRTTIPEQVKEDLLKVGLTHIVAVSGYNLTIMLNASKRLLAKRSKKLNTLLSFCLMAGFLGLTGASASIVRAALISSISIMVAYYGRQINPVHLIILAAAITAWVNPFFMWRDMGWYLSFLAFFGILVIAPVIKAKLSSRLSGSLLIGVAIESISAEIMALPFIIHFFGEVSLAGLPANILVVTFVPIAMLLSFIAGLSGMLAAPIAGWFAWPAVTILNYMLDIAHLIASMKNVFLENIGFTMLQMLAWYAFVVTYFLILLQQTNRQKADKITDTNLSLMQGAQLERT